MSSNYYYEMPCYSFLLFPIALLSLFFLHKTLSTRRSSSLLPLPPSPFSIPIIGHLHLLPPIPHQSFHSLSLRLGPLFLLRLGSVPCIVVSSPDIAREVLKTEESSFLTRPRTKTLSYITYNSSFAFGPYGAYWRFMRRIAVHQLLSPKTIDQLRPVRHEEMSKFVEGLHELSKQGVSVNVGKELIKLTIDAISRVAVGRRLSETERGAEEARRIIKENADLSGSFNLRDAVWVFQYFDFQGIGRRVKDAHERYDRMIEGIIKEKEEKRKGERGERRMNDLLDILLDVAEDESAEIRLTRNHIKAFILVYIR